MIRKHKKVVIILGVIILLFGLYNVVWYTIIWGKYGDFVEGMKELYSHRTYVIDELDGYTYNVKIPDYLSYTGNLGIQPSQNSDCALIIWPGIFKETKYGVFLQDENGRNHAIELTSEREAKPDAPEEVKQLVEEYRDKIDALFERADAQWDY